MYLNKILGSGTKINVLAVLVPNPDKLYVEKDLARECKTSLSEVNRQMPDLVNSGLVTMQRLAKVKVYRINREHFLFEPLKNLLRDLKSVYRELTERIVEYAVERHEIEAVLLLGSILDGSLREDLVKEPSDIDILFVSENKMGLKRDLLGLINSEISRKYGIVVYPIIMTREEYLKGLEDNPLIIKAHSDGEVIYGKKPRRFGQLEPAKSGGIPEVR